MTAGALPHVIPVSLPDATAEVRAGSKGIVPSGKVAAPSKIHLRGPVADSTSLLQAASLFVLYCVWHASGLARKARTLEPAKTP